MNQLAITNATIYTCSQNPSIPAVIQGGTCLVSGGKIVAVGKDLTIPDSAVVKDCEGLIITPGFIDAHCHIGLAEDGGGQAGNDGNEASDPVTSEVRALDGINPGDIAFKDAVMAGITCVQVDPGSANIIGGESVAIKTFGTIIDDLVIKRPCGMKAALGENPKRVYGGQRRMPMTRMGNAAIMRKALTEAKDYLRKKESADSPDKIPDMNLRHEALLPVIKKQLPLRIHCHRADDIMTALRIAEEFDIDISLEHCTEGDKIAEAVANSGFPVTMGPSLTDKSKLEVKNIGFGAPVALSKAGVKLAIVTDHPVLPIHYLRICAGLAIREGMDEEFALLAITRFPAEIMGVSDRVGSLEPGKDADMVIWSKDPFEYDAKPLEVFIQGAPILPGINANGGDSI